MPITVAPWLMPPNFLGAISSGAQAGLQLRQQDIAAQEAQARLALAQQQEAAANAQAAERLRLANEEMFQRARQEEISNQLKRDIFGQQLTAFHTAQERQNRLEDAQKRYGEALAQGLSGEKPDILRAGAMAIQAAPELGSKLDLDALLNAQNRAQQQGYSLAKDKSLEQKTGIQFLNPDGTRDDAAYLKAITKSNQMAEQGLKTGVQKRADDYLASLKKNFPDLSQDQLDSLQDNYVSSNGQAAIVPPKELQVITGGDALAFGLEKALQGVAAFNAKFGRDSFDQFQGPVDNRLFNLRRKFGSKFTKEDEIAARQIFQSVDQVAQAYRLANFGSALSQSEQKLFDKIIESPDSASFIPTLEGAIKTTKDTLGNKMDVYKYTTNIPLPIRQKYSVSSQNAIPQPSDRKVGEVYQTPRGPMKWTGTGWVPQ